MAHDAAVSYMAAAMRLPARSAEGALMQLGFAASEFYIVESSNDDNEERLGRIRCAVHSAAMAVEDKHNLNCTDLTGIEEGTDHPSNPLSWRWDA